MKERVWKKQQLFCFTVKEDGWKKEIGESGGGKEKQKWSVNVVKCAVFHWRAICLSEIHYTESTHSVCEDELQNCSCNQFE